MKSESILSITMLKINSQLNFFIQENLFSTACFTELRDHRNECYFSDIQTHCYVIDFSDNRKTKWFIRSFTTLCLLQITISFLLESIYKIPECYR